MATGREGGCQKSQWKTDGGERVGFSQPPAELNFTLQGSLFQDVIL